MRRLPTPGVTVRSFLPGLDEPEQRLWAAWRVAADRGLRREATRALHLFVARVVRYPPRGGARGSRGPAR